MRSAVTIALVIALTLAYAVAILRTISPTTKTQRDDRWAVRLGNWHARIVAWGARVAKAWRERR